VFIISGTIGRTAGQSELAIDSWNRVTRMLAYPQADMDTNKWLKDVTFTTRIGVGILCKN